MSKKYDWFLIAVTVLLVGTGLIILHAINFKDPNLAQDFDPTKQVVAVIIGFALLVVMARTDYRLWFRFSPVWYVGGLALLGLVLLIGDSASGAKLALNFGIIEFQPAEIMKIGVIMIAARFYSKYNPDLRRLRYLGLSLLYLALPIGLIMLQPELGSAVVIIFIWLVMTFTSNISKVQLVGFLAIGAAALPILISQLQPYQQERIQTFLNPANDPQGAGYNVAQATIAVGSGQLLGRGLGSGSQSQLNFLPAQHTDFVFAVLAEKLGFLGAGLVTILFLLVIIRGVMIAYRAQDVLGMLLATGVVAMFLFHITINIGMNLGIMPVTGIPLPLLSYGGTNMIVSLLAIGLLESIASHSKELEFKV